LSNWVFLTNHACVLIVIARTPDVTVRDIADQVGITERSVSNIVRELEEEGYIRSQRVGRRKRYTVEGRQPMRHPVSEALPIGQLLEVLAPAVQRRRPLKRDSGIAG
jgi:DNA-binding MarR family transcriptional regulator